MKSWGLPLWDLLIGRKKPAQSPVRPVQPPRPVVALDDGERAGERGVTPGRSLIQSAPSSPSLLRPGVHRPREKAAHPVEVEKSPTLPSPRSAKPERGEGARTRKPAARRETAAHRYERIAREMLAAHGVKVRKWRSGMSGVAWELKYHDGSVRRLIESPRPTGPMSMAIFLHEIGHHAIGFHRYKPRCLEEYHAWKFALDQMQAHGLNITEGVRRRVHRSLHYAIGKAQRRGLQALPLELEPFLPPPPKSVRKRRVPRRR